MFIGLFGVGFRGFVLGVRMNWIESFEFVVLPLAAVYGAACVLYVAAPFFCRLVEVVRR